MVNYREALALKASLRSDKYIAKSGNELKIFIAPEDAKALERWKLGLGERWHDHDKLDAYARVFCKDEKYILFGVRVDNAGKFYGGKLELQQYPELRPVKTTISRKDFK